MASAPAVAAAPALALPLPLLLALLLPFPFGDFPLLPVLLPLLSGFEAVEAGSRKPLEASAVLPLY